MNALHMGRSWVGHAIEDECPCDKAPCGLVDAGRMSPDCDQHPHERTKTIRQMHYAEDCPARRTDQKEAA